MTEDDPSTGDLRRSFTMRARAYAHMYDVLCEQFGAERAMELGQEITRRLGEQMGATFQDLEPTDLAGLKHRFLDGIPARDAMFAPEVERCDDERLQIYFHRCPLKQAWQEMGREGEDLAALCRMAGAIDRGLFTSAGFTFDSTTWQPGERGCCRLKITPGR
jgi:hypothetical protein